MKAITTLIKNSTGTASVEFALFMPLFLFMLFGIIELGGAWYQKQILIHASRDAARFSCVNDDSTVAQVEEYTRTILSSAGFPYVNEVSVVVEGAGGNTGDPVTVTVSTPYAFPVLGKIVSGFASSINLEATTVMRHE